MKRHLKRTKTALHVGVCRYGEHGRLSCELVSCAFIMAETRILLFLALALVWLVLDVFILIDKIEEHHAKAHARREAARSLSAGGGS